MDEILSEAIKAKERMDEALLARDFPAQYSAQVDGDPWNYVENGVRHVIVKDMGIEQRYTYKDGKLFPLIEGVF